MASSAPLIAQVEQALQYLLDPATPAAHKPPLEQQLTAFKLDATTCLPVLYELLHTSTNEYALWFATSTLEEYVATRWWRGATDRLAPTQRQQVRQFAWEYVTTATKTTATASPRVPFVLRKMRKVVADIARLEWTAPSTPASTPAVDESATQWPEFLDHMEALVSAPDTRANGLELLSVVTEEFGREDALVVASCRQRTRQKVTAELPRLLALLGSVLRDCNQSYNELGAQVTSAELQPQDRVAQVTLEALTHLITWAPVAEAMHETWLPLLFELSMQWQNVFRRDGGSPGRYGILLNGSSLSAMGALIELMGKRFAPGSMDDVVLQTMMGLCPLVQATVMDDAIMRAVNEEYLDKMTEFVDAFLTRHLKRLENPRYASVLPQFMELVMTLTTRQPHVGGFLNCLSVWELFVGYLEETEQIETAANEHVRQLLAVYENGLVGVMFHLLERVNYTTNRTQLVELGDEDDDDEDGEDPEDGESSAGKGKGNAAVFDIDGDTGDGGRYATGSLQHLAQWWAKRGSGSSNGSVAGVAGNVELSDRKEFVVECIALIHRIAAFPTCAKPLLDRLASTVRETCENMVFRLHETPALPVGSDGWISERSTFRDLTTNCAILSSVCAQHYCMSQELSMQTAGWQILHLFITLAEYATQHRLHTRGAVFVALQCEALASIRSCLSCVPFVLTQENARGDVLSAIESVMQVLLRTLDTTIVASPQVVMQNAMQLLANIGRVLPYDDLINVPSMVQLEANIHQFSQHLPLSIQGDLYTSMSNSILNSAVSFQASSGTGGDAMQRWANAYSGLILPIRESIDQSAITVQQNEHRILERVMVTQLQRDCYLVRSLAKSVETMPKIAKDGFYSTYAPSFPSLLSLLTTYFTTMKKVASGATGSSPNTQSQIKSALKVVNEIIRLYAQLLKSVRREMQKETVAEIMRIFVEIFRDAELSMILSNQGTQGVMVLCGFLQLLRIVVEEPTSLFSSFLQSILELCYGPLKEAIFGHAESEAVIVGYFVALVEQLLEKHYRFFVSPTTTFNADGQRERGFSSDVAHTYFVSIFESLAGILTRERKTGSSNGATSSNTEEGLSPRLCHQVLELLDRIDKTQGLFAFTGFKNEIRLGFLSTLMNILTHGEMNLLQDEVIGLIHRLAAVDFASFYQVFLPTYTNGMLTPKQLEIASNLGSGECLQWSGQTDLPTFTRDVHGFLNDIRVFKAQG